MKRAYLAVGILLLAAFAAVASQFVSKERVLTVAFLDVGQGDAIFIESPSGVQVLVDGGPDSAVLRGLSSVMPLWDRSIDMLIVSNPDQDHTRGFLDVLSRYDVVHVLEPGTEKETVVYEELQRSIEEEGAQKTIARRGMTFDLGGEAYLEILFPDRDVSAVEPNAGSIVARLVYGETEVFLAGDTIESVEKYLVQIDGEALESDILKAGHHGSRTSTSEELLGAVAPSIAVISAGKNSRYGHPHKEVLDRLAEFDVETHVTAQEGTVIYRSDGTQWFD